MSPVSDRSILDALPVGVWAAHVPSGRVAYANPEFRTILGVPPVEGSGIEEAPAVYGIFDRRGEPYAVDRLPFSRVVATGRPVVDDDLVIHRPDGRTVNLRAYAYPIGAGGDLTHVVIAFVDITAEVQAESRRRQIESHLSFAVGHAPIAIWSTDAEGLITMSEGAGLASLGVTSGQLVGQNIFDLYRDHPSVVDAIRRGLAGESFWYTVQVGEAVFDTWLTPVADAAGRVAGVTGLSNDVTAFRRLQAAAIQHDRVIALGTLAASVAHEINNPLTYILGHATLLGESLDQIERALAGLPEPARVMCLEIVAGMRESLDPVRSGTERIAGITRELRTFGSPTEETVLVDVQQAVRSVLKLVGKELESRAMVDLDLGHTSPIRGDSARLVQVVLNLTINAIQALAADRADTNRIWVRTAQEGDLVLIEVADNGPGIPPEQRERVFEPFQTTKDVGQGSGLGLFVCRNIVTAWSGRVTVEDRPGGGSRFRVALPAAQGRAAEAEAAAPVAAPRPAHVLIVDDEPAVANLLRMQLERAGYRVTVVHEGAGALERIVADDDIDLVFCDLMMRGMTGMDLADGLAARAPSRLARVVFMTGGAFTERALEFRSLHEATCMDKPFDIVAETARRLSGPPSPPAQA